MQTDRKIALVNCGSRGLGRNMALNVARSRHDVIITYRSRTAEAAKVKKGAEALGVGGPSGGSWCDLAVHRTY